MDKMSSLDSEELYLKQVAKFAWKHYGMSYRELMFESHYSEFFSIEEEMLISQDYETAHYEDTKPKD